LKNIFTMESTPWPELKWITVDDVLKKGKSLSKAKKPAVALPTITLDTIAFLQYTSGSTSDPKGVMISHRNLAHNLYLIMKEIKADRSTTNVSWLPQYHDMGLIGEATSYLLHLHDPY
jgi:acyl-CoA synthetase (AMP-forming)/AMP-acid ligase II